MVIDNYESMTLKKVESDIWVRLERGGGYANSQILKF